MQRAGGGLVSPSGNRVVARISAAISRARRRQKVLEEDTDGNRTARKSREPGCDGTADPANLLAGLVKPLQWTLILDVGIER